MKMKIKGNVDLDLEFELNEFEDVVSEKYCRHTKIKEYDYQKEALLPIIKYFNKMAFWIQKNNKLPKRQQEFFVYKKVDIDFILSQVIDTSIINIQQYPNFENCYLITLQFNSKEI